MRNKGTLFITQAAAIAAVYVVLTQIFAAISFGPIQFRISESLTILPYFLSAAVPGVTLGCLIGNILAGAVLPDIIFGTLATFIGAVFSRMLRKNKWLVPIPPVVSNALIIPFVLKYAYGEPLPIPFMMVTVGAGQVISCGILGLVLFFSIERYSGVIFKTSKA